MVEDYCAERVCVRLLVVQISRLRIEDGGARAAAGVSGRSSVPTYGRYHVSPHCKGVDWCFFCFATTTEAPSCMSLQAQYEQLRRFRQAGRQGTQAGTQAGVHAEVPHVVHSLVSP